MGASVLPRSQKQSIMQTTARLLQHQQLQNYFQTLQTAAFRDQVHEPWLPNLCEGIGYKSFLFHTFVFAATSRSALCHSQSFFHFFVRLLIVALVRGTLLFPSQVSWCGTVTGQGPCAPQHDTVSTRSLSHICAELDWCGTCAPPALLCCSTVSHISIWKNGQRSRE